MKNRILKFIVFFLFPSLLLSSCVAVKDYEKVYLNDPDMALSIRKIKKFEIAFHVYREGAAGANDGKSGGGCGCN